MADNDVDINEEDGSIENSEENQPKTSFLKSKLFLIIAGVILLFIVAGGGYYFFAATNEQDAETMEPEDPDKLVADDALIDGDSSTSMAEQMGLAAPSSSEDEEQVEIDTDVLPNNITAEDSNELVEIQQQNQQMKQQISELETQVDQIKKIIQQQQDAGYNNQANSLPLGINLDYQQDLSDSAIMREVNRTPAPKPNWGEFNRLNKQ